MANVVSVFDGMACGMIAMIEAGIKVDRYVAFEIDKYATKTSSHNFPMIEQRGDVFQADFTEFEGFDFLVGGSPCTYWSIAQTKNRETVASGLGWELFSQYVRALKEIKPKYFIYENNKSMSQAIRESISESFGFEPICINSALVSAQNRQRLYWVGIREEDGSYRKANIEQPEDMGILLKDVLDSGIVWRDKSHTIDATYYKGGTFGGDRLHQNASRLMVAEPIKPLSEKKMDYMVRDTKGFKGSNWNFLNTPDQDDKSMAVLANFHKGVPYNVCAESVCIAERGRYDENGEVYQHYEANDTGKTNVLTTVQKDNMIAEPVRVGTLPNAKGEIVKTQSARVFSTEGKGVTLTGCGGGAGAKTGLYAIRVFDGKEQEFPVYEVKDGQITVKGKQYPIKLNDGYYIIRKLTVSECMRLQTVPEWYEFPVSNSQAYKMLGNGWTINVIKWLLLNLD